MERLSNIRTVEDNYTVIMPTMAGVNAEDYAGVPFARLISSPDVVYVTDNNGHQKAIDNMFKTLSGNWPLLVIGIVFCFEAGILIWLLVSNVGQVLTENLNVLEHKSRQ